MQNGGTFQLSTATEQDLRLSTCGGLTHAVAQDFTSATVEWVPPNAGSGDITLVAYLASRGFFRTLSTVIVEGSNTSAGLGI